MGHSSLHFKKLFHSKDRKRQEDFLLKINNVKVSSCGAFEAKSRSSSSRPFSLKGRTSTKNISALSSFSPTPTRNSCSTSPSPGTLS